MMIESLPIGAHLTSPRHGYLHHGIYAGAGQVIHYSDFKRLFPKGRVEQVPLDRFSRGRSVQVKASAAPAFSGVQAVERARTRLGENRYRFWSTPRACPLPVSRLPPSLRPPPGSFLVGISL
jgi:hypothetical protein